MKNFLSILFLIFIFHAEQTLGQQLNLDNEDIEEAFKSLGIQIFKFPINLDKGNYKARLEIEYYKNSKSVFRKSLVDSLTQSKFPVYFHITNYDSLIHVYLQEKNKTETLKIRIGKSSTSDTIKFYDAYVPYFDWKLLTYNKIVLNQFIPILLKYVPHIETISGKQVIRQCLPGLKETEFRDFFSEYAVVRVMITPE